METRIKTAFEIELEQLLNKHNQDGLTDTPDFILAEFLTSSLAAFHNAVYKRDDF